GLAAQSGTQVPAGFVERRPQEIVWQPNPNVPNGQVAVLVGRPTDAGPLIVRAKFPPRTVVPPHTHPEARTYTVISGEWKLGFGEAFDAAQLRSYPPGSMYRLPAAVPHFQASGDVETIVQIESIGPSRTDFLQKK